MAKAKIKLKKTLYIGLGGTGVAALLKVKKCFNPKSIPIELSNVISESDTICFSTSDVWTMKLTK